MSEERFMDALSFDLQNAALMVLQDRGHFLEPSPETLEIAGSIRVAMMHVLAGKTPEEAADLVKKR